MVVVTNKSVKSNPNNILREAERAKKKLYPILFYGNESGLVSKLIKSIYNILQNQLGLNGIQKFDHKNDKENTLEDLLKNNSLFSKVNFIVLNNPQEMLVEELKKIESIESVLIINGEGIGAKSKIRKYFDDHQQFISVPCYNFDKQTIKETVDKFLSDKKITLQNNTYWYLIDNISDECLVLENELQKLYNYNNPLATIGDIQKLIAQKNNYKADNYFFICATGNYKLILKDINMSVNSINDSYEILGSTKKFIQILSDATLEKNNNLDYLVQNYLPKYLFMKKEIFKNVLKKINIKKISIIVKLLQKTEYLLRRNSAQHLEIIERFLLNFIKIIK